MRFKLFLKVFLPLLAIFLVAGVFTGLTVFSQIRDNKLAREENINYKFILNQARTHLSEEYFSDPNYQGNEVYFRGFMEEIGTD